MANDENKGQSWEYPETNRPPSEPPRPQTPLEGAAEAVQEVIHPATTPPREPSAPRPRVADDLLLLFGRLAAAILFGVMLLTGLEALLHPEKDLSGVYNLINTQLSLIIGAVLGYAAHPAEKERD